MDYLFDNILLFLMALTHIELVVKIKFNFNFFLYKRSKMTRIYFCNSSMIGTRRISSIKKNSKWLFLFKHNSTGCILFLDSNNCCISSITVKSIFSRCWIILMSIFRWSIFTSKNNFLYGINFIFVKNCKYKWFLNSMSSYIGYHKIFNAYLSLT